MFAHQIRSKSTADRNELDRYLSSDTEDVGDVLQWWMDRRSTFPRLSRMALDYLGTPGRFSCVLPYPFAHYTSYQQPLWMSNEYSAVPGV
jgi:hypothetical protein